jgi:hypothetical protein
MIRSSIFQGAVIAPESAYGEFSLPDTRLGGASLSHAINAVVKSFKPKGNKFATVASLGKEFSNISLEGMLAYNDMPYLLSSLMKTVTPTGATAAKSWAFSKASNAPDTAQSYSGLFGDGLTRQNLVQGMMISELGFEFSRDEVNLSGSGFARAIQEGASVLKLTITGTPTGGTFILTYNTHATAAIAYNATAATVAAALAALADFSTDVIACYGGPLPGSAVHIVITDNDAILASEITATPSLTGGTTPAVAIAAATVTDLGDVVVQATDVSVYLADSAATLGAASALENALSAGWKMSGVWGQFWPLKRGESFTNVVDTDLTAEVTLKVLADAGGMALLSNMREGASKFIRIGAISETMIGVTSTPYSLTIDAALKVKSVSEFSDEDGVYAVEWTFDVVHDATWGKATEITPVCSLTAL